MVPLISNLRAEEDTRPGWGFAHINRIPSSHGRFSFSFSLQSSQSRSFTHSRSFFYARLRCPSFYTVIPLFHIKPNKPKQ